MSSKPVSPKSQTQQPRVKTSRLQRWRPFFWRWHRRVGLSAAVIVVLVSISGILLNHTSELALGKSPVRQAWLLNHYGVALPKLVSYQVGSRWLSGDDHQYLYLDGQQIAYCSGSLVGSAETEGLLVAACSNELILVTSAGEVVERLGATYGLPTPLTAVGYCGEILCVSSKGQNWSADLQQLEWREIHSPGHWSKVSPLPALIRAAVLDAQLGSDLSWERVMQDLHSGRIVGQWGVWLVDLAALFLLFLSLSGFLLWYQQARRRRK